MTSRHPTCEVVDSIDAFFMSVKSEVWHRGAQTPHLDSPVKRCTCKRVRILWVEDNLPNNIQVLSNTVLLVHYYSTASSTVLVCTIRCSPMAMLNKPGEGLMTVSWHVIVACGYFPARRQHFVQTPGEHYH